jgi:hypothetical protein
MLTRYFTKTLCKGFTLQKTMNSVSRLAPMTQNYNLFRISKMAFFDYDNKDKNIFSSDDEEQSSSYNAQNTQSEGGFFTNDNKNSDIHVGRYEVSEIPLYISKMRNELRERWTHQGHQDDVKHYFGNMRGFIAMHYQNREEINSQFPRSSPIFYEYAAYRRLVRENQFLAVLEDHIIKENITNMPVAGIKNFLTSMLLLQRGRESVVNKVVELLNERECYNDTRRNIPILTCLNQLRS